MVQETEEDKGFLQSTADFFKNLNYGQLAEESIPLVGENIIIGDIKENLKEGSLGSAALNTGALAIGTVPIVGDLAARPFRALAKKYSKAQNALKEAIKKSETSSNSYYTRPKEKLKKAATHFFKTAQVSEYVRVGGGATVRDKKPRNAVMHRGQGGPQPPSEVTVYLDDEAAIHAESLITDTKGSDGLSIFKLVPTRAVDEKTGIGRAKVVYSEDFGKGKFLKKKGETKKNNVGKNRKLEDAEFSFTTTPKVGLTPFEIFDQHSAHIGNKITEVAPVSAADILKYNKKELKMAEGGPVMALEEQTEMAFGGESPRIDPVSGNEVPPGALPSEVRDDIPARLSEGEYVVPADVLQYYGIKFFEDLRGKAKMELASMEENGRMGGEPVDDASMDGMDDLPFSAEELNTYDDDQGEPVREFQEGGPVTEMASLQPQTFVKTYVNSEGSKLYIRFVNGVAIPPVPPGYFEEGAQVEGVAPVAPVDNTMQEQDRDPELDQSITDGTKPPNRQTVGELIWTIQRSVYKDAFPDSLTAAVAKSGSKAFPIMGAFASMLEGPTTLEESIKEAKERLERGKDYQGVPLTDEEIKGLNSIIDLEGKKGADIYQTIYDGYDIHLGLTDKDLGYIRNIGVPNLKKPLTQKQKVNKRLNRKLSSRDSTGTKFKRYEYDGQNLTAKGRKDLIDDVEKRYNIELESKGTTPTQPRSNFRDDDDNSQGTTASVTTPNTVTYSGEDDKGRPTGGKAKDESVTAFENQAGGRFMNKGGLATRKNKKK